MKHQRIEPRDPERGAVLFFVAATLIVLLGLSALAIDLAALYVVRNEAQRAADAAALAGAKKFVESGFLSGLVSQSTAQTLATSEAIAIGAQNLVGGQAADIQVGDITFDFANPANPLITVQVQRTAARGNAVPTFFGKALGVASANVSAAATAEAYTPSGGDTPIGTGCVKPWILPNCDPLHSSPENPDCPGSAYYVDPTTGQVANPGSASSGGTIGQQLLLKPGLPGDAPVPSQFYPIQIPPGDEPALCPQCAQTSGSSGPGAALYERNISCCNTNQLTCGVQVELNRQTGNMVGPTSQGVRCLIHQASNNCGGSASSCGQDYLQSTSTLPIPIVGGANNPNPALQGQLVSSSDSIVTVPLYNGAQLCPGGADTCGVATIVGFLQVFVEKVGPPQATVTGYVLNIAGCGAGGSGGGSGGGGTGGSGSGSGGSGSGGSGTLSGAGGSLFPVRLVRPPS